MQGDEDYTETEAIKKSIREGRHIEHFLADRIFKNQL